MQALIASILGCALAAPVALADPPHSPYDNTVFAPVKKFGPRVAVEVVASGLVAPLKGVTAPGERDKLYVVDQVGKAGRSTSIPRSGRSSSMCPAGS